MQNKHQDFINSQLQVIKIIIETDKKVGRKRKVCLKSRIGCIHLVQVLIFHPPQFCSSKYFVAHQET
jgi:hypothetical protein